MYLHKSKLGTILAGCYALLISVVLYFDFQSLSGDFWSWASLVLTLPWSVGVIFVGFLLMHVSSYGMEYGFAVGAVLNAIILHLGGQFISGRRKRRSS
jgi:hypothetical protein